MRFHEEPLKQFAHADQATAKKEYQEGKAENASCDIAGTRQETTLKQFPLLHFVLVVLACIRIALSVATGFAVAVENKIVTLGKLLLAARTYLLELLVQIAASAVIGAAVMTCDIQRQAKIL